MTVIKYSLTFRCTFLLCVLSPCNLTSQSCFFVFYLQKRKTISQDIFYPQKHKTTAQKQNIHTNIECQHKVFVFLLIICSFLRTLPLLRFFSKAKIRKSQIGKTCRSSRRCWDHPDYSEYHAAPAICWSLYLYSIWAT